MKDLPGNNEKSENNVCHTGKDITREQSIRMERSSVDLAEMNQLTRQPGSYPRDARVAKAPVHSPVPEKVAPIKEEPKEIDHIQKTNEEDQRRLAQFNKVNRPPKEPPKQPLEMLRMSKKVFHEIKQTIGSLPVETGGLLMGNIEDFQVTGFIFDNVSYEMRRRAAVWYPHTESLNEQVETYERKGFVFLGVVHSHPHRCIHPSGPDEAAAWSNMTSPNNSHLNAYLLPIVQSNADGPFEYRSYIATCHPEGQGRVIVERINLYLFD